MGSWLNLEVAARLDEMAQCLSDPAAAATYARAAAAIRELRRPVSEILHAEGLAGLERVPGITPAVAPGVRELVRTGRLPALDELRAASALEAVAP